MLLEESMILNRLGRRAPVGVAGQVAIRAKFLAPPEKRCGSE
jgi:hypothetical protein